MKVYEQQAWENMKLLEPELAQLEQDLRTVVDGGGESFCANVEWCKRGGGRARLQDLVGNGARQPRLSGSGSYELAYKALYACLPDCRNCFCARDEDVEEEIERQGWI